MTEKLYTVTQIEKLTGISRHILRNWCKAGRGPRCYWTAGQHRRFKVQDVLNWYYEQYVTEREEGVKQRIAS